MIEVALETSHMYQISTEFPGIPSGLNQNYRFERKGTCKWCTPKIRTEPVLDNIQHPSKSRSHHYWMCMSFMVSSRIPSCQIACRTFKAPIETKGKALSILEFHVHFYSHSLAFLGRSGRSFHCLGVCPAKYGSIRNTFCSQGQDAKK